LLRIKASGDAEYGNHYTRVQMTGLVKIAGDKFFGMSGKVKKHLLVLLATIVSIHTLWKSTYHVTGSERSPSQTG